MTSTTQHNQGLMVAGGVASVVSDWSAIERTDRNRGLVLHAAAAATIPAVKPATDAKPFHGYVRRPLEGSS
jgi:hypothetical protein